MKTITITNDYHHTAINLRIAPDGKLSQRQIRKAKKTLCCSDCICSGPLGERGHQDGFEIIFYDNGRGGTIYGVEFDAPSMRDIR